MKKFLTFVLVLAMVLSVSSVALAAYTGDSGATVDNAVASINDGTNTYYYMTLQNAINDAQKNTGDVTIDILKNLTESSAVIIEILQYKDLDLTINGNNCELTNISFKLNGYGGGTNYQGEDTLTIKNIKFKSTVTFPNGMIDAFTINNNNVHNVTIEECDFELDSGTPAMKFRACFDIAIKGCDITAGHSLVQSRGCTGFEVIGCYIGGTTEGGIALGTNTGCVVRDCNIDVAGYGIRVDGDAKADVIIADSDITAEKPVIVRKATGNCDLDVSDTKNTFTPTGNNMPIIKTAGDDKAAVVTPTGTVTQTGDVVAKNGNTYYTNADTAKNEAKPEDTVYPVEDGVVDTSAPIKTPAPVINPTPDNKPSGSGISVKYNGGNSFSTSNPAVPTGVEIDNVPVSFTGNGSNFTVSGIPAGAKWITVRWNSTSVTTNFTPNGAYFAEVEIPKTGDMSFWAAIAEFLGF